MRVAILTNFDERCGNATYAENLEKALRKYVGGLYVTRYDRPEFIRGQGFHIVIINWHPARVHADIKLVQNFQADGSKVILLYQNSFHLEQHVTSPDILTVVDAVVAHEKMTFHGAPVNFHHIPHGVIEIDNLPPCEPGVWGFSLGTAGFPFPWKRFDLLVSLMEKYGYRTNLIAPQHPFYDSSKDAANWAARGASVTTLFHSEDEVIRQLAKNTVNIFWFQTQGQDDELGQSGSALLGLASRRPLIISTHRKLWQLLPYAGKDKGIHVCQTEAQVETCLKELLSDMREGKELARPLFAYNNMRWGMVAERWETLFEELVWKPRTKNF